MQTLPSFNASSLCEPNGQTDCYYFSVRYYNSLVLTPTSTNKCLTTSGVFCESLCDNLSTCSSPLFCLAREGSTYTLVLYSQSTVIENNSTVQCKEAPAESLVCSDSSCALDLSQYGLAPSIDTMPPDNGSNAQNTQQIFLYLILPLIALAVTLPCIFLKLRNCLRTV
jgi:hypothetical protein